MIGIGIRDRGRLPVQPAQGALPDGVPQPVRLLRALLPEGCRSSPAAGLRYGAFCLGCCWALRPAMFGIGVGSLAFEMETRFHQCSVA
jgi:hypothetical protein